MSLKPIGGIPGDASAEQMEAVADIAEEYSADEIRVTHEQNLVLPHVALADLEAVYRALVAAGLATANVGFVTDIIACPGLDYCALANARSIPVAQSMSERFADPARQQEIGELKIKISGCINACGHHHVGHIGLLGVEKKGAELYQITLGGSADEQTSIGDIVGRGFEPEKVTDAVETIVETYLALRQSPSETFLAAYRRVGAGTVQGRALSRNRRGCLTHDAHLERNRLRRKRSVDHRRKHAAGGAGEQCGAGSSTRSCKRWKGRPKRAIALAVLVEPADDVSKLAPHLDRLALVAVAFPAFNDGRAFSHAALLRTRHGYRGEIRAVGDVLIDQIPLMLRCGIDSFAVSDAVALKRLEEGRLTGNSAALPAGRTSGGGHAGLCLAPHIEAGRLRSTDAGVRRH